MSEDRPQPDPGELALEDLNEAEREAVENFTFEASARMRAEAGSRSAVVDPKQRTRTSSEQRQPQSAATPHSGPLSSVAKEAVTPQRSAVVAAKRKSLKATSKRSSRRPVAQSSTVKKPAGKQTRRKTPPWVVSLGVHVTVLLLFSFLTLATLEPEEFLEWAAAPANDEIEQFQEIEFESVVNFEEIETEFPTELEDPGLAALGELSAENAFADLSETGPLSGDAAAEWGSLFGDQGQGLAELGLDQGNALTSFFGTQSQARDVVFVIDNTGSMANGGLETVIVEMMKTVDGLGPKQRFYVLFFSDQVYPLFFPQSTQQFIHPTSENKQQLRRWLDSVEFCTGGVWQLTQALESAYQLQPDVVYLLTDGRHWDAVRASYKVAAVKKLRSQGNANGTPVHTLGMGCQTDFDRENLAKVAEANGGTFREVKVSPRMIDVASAKNRPKHDYNTGPGAVWGTLVPQRRNSQAP